MFFYQENYKFHNYAKAQNLARTLTKAYDDALNNYDVLVMPTVRFKSPELMKQDTPVGGQWHETSFNVAIVNLILSFIVPWT